MVRCGLAERQTVNRTEHCREHVDDVKTDGSRRSLTVASELLQRLQSWKQMTQFSSPNDWVFASPVRIGRLPYSYTGVWRELQRAAEAAVSANSARTHSGTRTVLGLTQWELR